jgi:type II secretory pathway component PulM
MTAWRDLHPRDRRALTVGALVLLSGLLLSFGVRPFLHARALLRDRLREQRGLLARELELVAAADRLPVEVGAAERVLDAARDRLFPNPDALSATAALVSAVGDVARREGVLLEVIEAGAPEATGGRLVAVRVDVRGRGDIEGLLRWLAALEGARRLLRVDQLGVARASTGVPTHAADVEVLTLHATVRGYLLPEATQ